MCYKINKIRKDDLLLGSYKTMKCNKNKEINHLIKNSISMNRINSISLCSENIEINDIDIKTENNTDINTENETVSLEKQKDIIINDPRFGLFNIFKYHIKHRNDNIIHEKYLSNIFNLIFILPILLFFSQWIIFTSLVAYQINNHNKDFCPNNSTIYHKMLMFGIGIIYFIRSFDIWDSVCNHVHAKKTHKMNSICSIIDTYHELLFTILIYLLNIIIIYNEDSITDLILNCLAMEFLLELDNIFKYNYCNKLTDTGIKIIFDKYYVTPEENYELINNYKSKFFRIIKKISYIPYKILILFIILFPLICFFLIFIGTICK